MKGMILSNTNVSNELARSRQHARQDTRKLTTQAKSQHDEIKAEFKEMKEEMQLLRAVMRCFDEQSHD